MWVSPGKFFGWLGLLCLMGGCDVYDATLLQRRTVARTEDAGGRDGGDSGQDGGPEVCGPCEAIEHGVSACLDGVCQLDHCDEGYAHCDADLSSCETSTRTLVDCGDCGRACGNLPHAVATCMTGKCAVATCEGGHGDCDGRVDNGCETPLDTLTDCGGCGEACDKASCAGGVCSAVDCSAMPNTADCDGDGASCETDLSTDPMHCGGCDSPCAFDASVGAPNGSLTCQSGACTVTCDVDHVDCDGDYRNGCEGAATDADGDGIPGCLESCPDDPDKRDPGVCGCGTPDTDRDDDGTADCDDACPADPTTAGPCLGFVPSNFDPRGVDWSQQPDATLDCGPTTLDTGNGSRPPSVSNWCGAAPSLTVQPQAGGPDLVVAALHGLMLAAGQRLEVVGERPLILGIDGDATIAGEIVADASGTTPGPGGNWSCGGSGGGDGSGQPARFEGASGGGGGGFGTAGGRAGVADTDGSRTPGGSAGSARGSNTLSPLIGGCGGGRAGGCNAAGAGGGGALQITAAGTLTVTGAIRVNGGDGGTPCGQADEGGGTGGGSGGAILLEATVLDTPGELRAHGGRGGANGQYVGIFNCGNTPGGAGSTSASDNGQDGSDCQGGSPGGGGGHGRVVELTR